MNKIEELIQKGVRIPNPESVYIDNEVQSDRIADDLVLFAGCKLLGQETYIASGVRIGFEGPVTVQNCYVGPGVALDGGFFSGSVFLAGARCGSGAHVRDGTILEEKAGIAHTVGLKQTILFPFVTLGSLINFCDCLMAGGTSPRNHSEVGSAYIHFNYTPNQDKATPSLLGDVPRGVMLNQSPIFLGGQGGLVGPCVLNFGTVVAAGTICRHDQFKANQLVFGGTPSRGSVPYKPAGYPNLKRIIRHNVNYLANLAALGQWYARIRSNFIGPQMPKPLFEGLQKVLEKAVNERLHQFERLVNNIEQRGNPEGPQAELCRQWQQMKAVFNHLRVYAGDPAKLDHFSNILHAHKPVDQGGYLETIQALSPYESALGSEWLDDIVAKVNSEVLNVLPSTTK